MSDGLVSVELFNIERATGDRIRSENDRLRAINADLLEALREAINVVKIFHGPPAWDIYENNAPEMQRWKAAIAKAEDR